jgi:23S rRNA (cytidine1920-2'-O)/16S rRNA (cytidine1409-2'-O)-methyltransferase
VNRRRLDLELVRRGLAATLDEARETVAAGGATVNGGPVSKPGTMVTPQDAVELAPDPDRYVSRGGEKLAGALERFGVDPAGRRCLDAGVSTGGFTDVLLRQGAEHVTAVDVGYGQLAWALRQDPRVTVMERTNARDLRPEGLTERADLVVADLSFISLAAVVPALVAVAADGAELVLLIKPQFEARREEVAPGGVVHDSAVWRRVVEEVAEACRRSGAGPLDVMPSPLRGPAGNVEFLIHVRKGHPGGDVDVDAAIAEARTVRESA